MSEFYASDCFLDKDHLFTQYHSIISCIASESTKIQNVINRLRQCSGYGIEAQIASLTNCRNQLWDYKEDVRAEYYSLAKIVDTINSYENKATGIMAGVSDVLELAGFDKITSFFEPIDSCNDGYSSIFKDVYDIYVKTGKNVVKALKEFFKLDFLDKWGSIPKIFSDAIRNILSPTFYGLNAIGKVMDTISLYTDGEVSLLDLAKTSENTVSFLESALKITEFLGDVKIFPNTDVPISDTLIIGGKHIGNVTQYLPVVNVVLSTIVSGLKTYEKVSADGEVSLSDGCEIVIDGATDGLITCAEAFICLACPPAAIGVGIFEISNMLVESFHGTSLKDMAKEKIKDFAKWAGEKLGSLLGNVSFA